MKARLFLLIFFTWLSATALTFGAALGTAFTYQGHLLDGGVPGNGLYDFEFSLFSTATGGTPTAGPIVKDDVRMTNGLFTVELDFGAGAFGAEARWLAMGVRNGTNNAAPFVALPTRQALLAVPQSQFALLSGSVLDGVITAGKIAIGAVTTDKIQSNAVTAVKIAAGQIVKSLNGLKDDVVLEAGTNVTLTTNGNRLRIAAASGSATLDSAQVMSIVLANDGIGSGISADFLDGKDSALFALKSEVEDRLRKDGDTMSNTLTVQPPNTSQALIVTGNRRGNFGNAVAYFSNRTNQTDNAPAVRIENTSGTSPDGAISVSNNGQGYIARFGNSSKYVASLDTNGTLTVDASVASGTKSVLDVKNNGNGRLATFGNATEGKLWIDKDGNLTTASGYVNAPGGLLTSGNLTVGGNATISGNVTYEGTMTLANTGTARIVAGGTTITVASNGGVTVDLAGGDFSLTARDLNFTALRSFNVGGPLINMNGLRIPAMPPGVVELRSDVEMRIKSTDINLEASGAVRVKAAASQVSVDGSGVSVKAPTLKATVPLDVIPSLP